MEFWTPIVATENDLLRLYINLSNVFCQFTFFEDGSKFKIDLLNQLFWIRRCCTPQRVRCRVVLSNNTNSAIGIFEMPEDCPMKSWNLTDNYPILTYCVGNGEQDLLIVLLVLLSTSNLDICQHSISQ
ncbi:hypothetical protein C446_01473 [Halobiforma nitratireducens JCM 10879]|uniref:Uncharacterized protein n=1 Tax=Halobiforma nitratireducens JCM 10879 TaxID=1227454 RepID=M0MMC8_9EURY|nr:hypothetical protein C446_01473 [Halobiforma nitratireducens JCM 10879]